MDTRKLVVYISTSKTPDEVGRMAKAKKPRQKTRPEEPAEAQPRKPWWEARLPFGAPPKRRHKPGERAALSLRMAPDLKRRLDAAAEYNGRSQSQEAEFRLERSFDRDELLADVLTTAYGSKEVAGLVMALGEAIQTAGTMAYHESKRKQGAAESRGAWLLDPFGCTHARYAALAVLHTLLPLRPFPEDAQPLDHPLMGTEIAIAILTDVRVDSPTTHRTQAIRRLLGPLLSEIPPKPGPHFADSVRHWLKAMADEETKP